jgi:hypothetical protein
MKSAFLVHGNMRFRLFDAYRLTLVLSCQQVYRANSKHFCVEVIIDMGMETSLDRPTHCCVVHTVYSISRVVVHYSTSAVATLCLTVAQVQKGS